MLDTFALSALGRVLRADHAARPKGAIPDRLWKLLLALEQAEKPRSDARPDR